MEQAVQVKLYLDGDVKGQKIVQEAILAALEEVGTCFRLDNFTSATIFSREIAVVVPQKQAEAQEAA